jgi:hypothetical protein
MKSNTGPSELNKLDIPTVVFVFKLDIPTVVFVFKLDVPTVVFSNSVFKHPVAFTVKKYYTQFGHNR